MSKTAGITKLETHLPGLDRLLRGGLPENRVTLVAGTSGSAKTVLSMQYLVAGAQAKEPGVYVTLEETPDQIRANMAGFGWDIEGLERGDRLVLVDATDDADAEIVTGDFDFGGLIARVRAAVERVGAKRVVIDSAGAAFLRYGNPALVRRELGVVSDALREMGVTALITVERVAEDGPVSRFDVEEFVADNVVVLRNRLSEERRRRTIEILKVRGAQHSKGEYPFSVLPETALQIVPLNDTRLEHGSTSKRITSGVTKLDEMLGGGLFRDAVTVVSGATGTGKTLLSTHFMTAGAKAGDRSLLLAFEESPAQLARNARSWGFDERNLEDNENVKIVSVYPEMQSLEDHLVMIREIVSEFKPRRISLDSMSALERISDDRQFREFCIGLISFVKSEQIATILTSTTPGLAGGQSVTDAHVSTLTDTIVLLRYTEQEGLVDRAMHVLKMRGSWHDPAVRAYKITDHGMKIGKPYEETVGIIKTPVAGQGE